MPVRTPIRLAGGSEAAVLDEPHREPRGTDIKVVYFGVGLAGKTSNLLAIERFVAADGDVQRLSSGSCDPTTLVFDYLAVDEGAAAPDTRIHLYSVPGRVANPVAWPVVLKNCDVVIFVADSQHERLGANVEAREQLSGYLRQTRQRPPIVHQYNKRDLPNALPVAELAEVLQPAGRESTLAVASEGTGVIETLNVALGTLAVDPVVRVQRGRSRIAPYANRDQLRR